MQHFSWYCMRDSNSLNNNLNNGFFLLERIMERTYIFNCKEISIKITYDRLNVTTKRVSYKVGLTFCI